MYSLKNWITKLGLTCKSSFEIGFFGSCFFLGYISSCLIFPPLADKYGRKKFIIAVQIEQAICYLFYIFVPYQYVYYATIFVFGSSVPLKNMVAYTHLAEFLPSRVSKMSALMLFLDGMILVISPMIFQFVTNQTDVFLYAGLLMNIIGLAAFTL